MEASKLADEFNRHVSALPGFDPRTTPKITFLDCEVLVIDEGGRQQRGMLVEKMIDDGKYTKWNSNGGHVKGQAAANNSHHPIDVERELARLTIGANASAGAAAIDHTIGLDLGAIEEEEEEEEEESESDEERKSDDDESADEGAQEVGGGLATVPTEAFPQAFSHFTHRFTGRKMLVCDLQGVYNTSPLPLFELTDPAIHYASTSDRQGVFGT